MPTGYSKRTLVEKLGLKPGARAAFLHAPAGYRKTLGPLPPKVTVTSKLGEGHDFIHFFTREKHDLEGEFPKMKKALAPDGALWISWPKGASGVATDLNENVVRDIALSNGLVDVKVCAVDEIWSGLKLVYRLRDRK